MHRLTVSTAACLIFFAMAAQSSASVTLLGTRLFYYCQQTKQTLTFLGDHLNSASVITAWVDEQPHQLLPHLAQAPFAVFPPQFQIQTQRQQKVALMYVASPESCPTTQEAVYYFYFLDSPMTLLQQPDTAQYLSMVKLFLRPPHLRNNSKGGGAQLSIGFDPQTAEFTIRNPSPYHVTISRWQRAQAPAQPLAEPIMVPPHSTLRHHSSNAAIIQPYERIVISTLDDFGHSHRSTHTLISH